MAELGSDWYLDRIEVTGPEGVCWRFPCDAWFGRGEGGDYTGEIQLDPLSFRLTACPMGQCANASRILIWESFDKGV